MHALLTWEKLLVPSPGMPLASCVVRNFVQWVNLRNHYQCLLMYSTLLKFLKNKKSGVKWDYLKINKLKYTHFKYACEVDE